MWFCQSCLVTCTVQSQPKVDRFHLSNHQTPTPSTIHVAKTPSNIDVDILDVDVQDESPMSMGDIPSPIRATGNPGVTVRDNIDTSTNPRTKVPPPDSAFSPSVSLADTPAPTLSRPPSSDASGSFVLRMPHRQLTKGQKVVTK